MLLPVAIVGKCFFFDGDVGNNSRVGSEVEIFVFVGYDFVLLWLVSQSYSVEKALALLLKKKVSLQVNLATTKYRNVTAYYSCPLNCEPTLT